MPKNLMDKAAIIKEKKVREHIQWWKLLNWNTKESPIPYAEALLQDGDKLKEQALRYMKKHLAETRHESGTVATYKKLFGEDPC